MRRIRPTVRLRLTLLYGSLFLVAGVLLLTLMYALLSNALQPQRRDDDRGGGGGPQGQVVFDGTPDAGDGRFDDGPRDGDTGGAGFVFDGTPGTGAGFAIDGTPEAGDSRTVQEQIDAARQEERDSALRQVKVQAGIALAVATLVALLLGWVLAGRVLQPLRAITGHAREASEATLSSRIALQGPPDELKELADTIDGMLERLESAFDAQRRFAAQASHELRTPLAIIRAEADVVLANEDVSEREARFGGAVRAAADRSERLVDGLLALARSESTLRDNAEIDLAELVGDIVGEHARSADLAGVELDLELDAAQVSGDQTLLGRMVGNLIENAIRYNAPGGWVRVFAGTESGDFVVRVANSGPVVDPSAVVELFEPFRRGTTHRGEQPGGHGLGLAIVKSVAAVHGGRVEATARPEGGLIVDVVLPSRG